jgi:nicotinate-nucleotide adenylyltransferase
VTGTSALEQRLARIGILGGTFNPPHLGHLALARHARDELSLERVVLMPVHTPPHKPGGEDPGPEHRLAMCRLAAGGQDGLSACGLELERGGPSYTADTLEEIHERHPEAELTFIVGADTARTLPSWHQPRRVLGLAALAVAARSGSDRQQVGAAIEEVGRGSSGAPPRIHFLEMTPIEASSSMARRRLATGASAAEMLPAEVAAYIAEHGLYRGAGGEES